MALYKVWSADRVHRKLIKASSIEQLKQLGCEKLGYPPTSSVQVVLEQDGTELDDDEYLLTLPSMTRLVLLQQGQVWSSAAPVLDQDQPDASIDRVAEPLIDVLHALKSDLTSIITLNKHELQAVISVDTPHLCHHLSLSLDQAHRIQDQCQRYLDELQDSEEAMELVRMIQNKSSGSQVCSGSQECSDEADGPSGSKRSKTS